MSDQFNLFPAPDLPVVEKPLREAHPVETNAHFDEHGKLIKVCKVCAGPAMYGFGVYMMKGHLGMWYCAEHAPMEYLP